MARSVSLAAYLALARRAPPSDWRAPEGLRPPGTLIWGHAAEASRITALVHVAERLSGLRGEVRLLLTLGEGVRRPERLGPGVILADLPPENMTAAEAFMAHWAPDVGLWTSGHLRPALLTCAGRHGLPMFLVGATEEAFEDARWRWLPDMGRALLGQFDRIFAHSANAARRLQRLGALPARIEVTGPLQEGGVALPCDEALRAEIATTLAGRPVWLAAMVRLPELPTVIEAHRLAARAAHRLLLILVPDDEDDGPEFARICEAESWTTAIWSNGDMPQENTQILLADTRGEMGLWYRLAPVTFMASSLQPGFGGSDPFEPAGLGSAVLYGPHSGRFLPAYKRFAAAGAARIVRDADTLSAAVNRLTAPDHAAAMACAAWTVATEGAEVTDRLLELVQDELDRRTGH
ncbi:3-deoxy-D-manno-octulosonic acid transferase [Pseudooceanicola sp. 216_PA32_1]|uniref:3-deoxy-D-manno-octulosonic acid transferase n=1 Tax=Pseudooceanicola pacificus TaxID=2676438 RepID=A0A844W219_9RHOB|nr:glycosyltransferase N-terminal domain-containing protein [Pseudooceanicola pacificus]MWB76734.1 3-deoxy-D-manno-octulosonic acid transferase [Pseudooceanicola pacificus]